MTWRYVLAAVSIFLFTFCVVYLLTGDRTMATQLGAIVGAVLTIVLGLHDQAKLPR